MRVEFVQAVNQVLAEDNRSCFITGDLGFRALEGLAAAYGRRFLNAGVAEQNMVGVAAGMALSGFQPWVYSIASFATYRCLEQIRNDVCLLGLPVRIVGNGGGYTYGIMGSTHHALEDIAVLKALPNLQLYFPCANDHVAQAVQQIRRLEGPAYLRLSISPFATDYPVLAENPTTLTRHYAKGNRWTIIGIGHGTQIVLEALAKHNLAALDVDVFGVAKFPFDLEADDRLVGSVKRTRRVLTIEEHYLPGSISESLKLALPDTEQFEVMCARYTAEQRYGTSRFHLMQCGLTPEKVIERLETSVES